MKNTLFILGLVISVAAYSQTDTIQNNDSGLSTRQKLNEDILKGNDHADTIPVLRTDINTNVDTLEIIRSDVNTNKGTGTDNAASISDLDDTVAVHLDTLQAIRPDVNTNTATGATNATNISNNSVAIGTKLTSTDTTAMLAPYATNDTTAAIRVDVNKNSDSIVIHRDDLNDLITGLVLSNNRISVLEGADVAAPYPDSAWILPDNDSTIFILFNEAFDENATFTVNSAFSFTYGEVSYTAGSVDSTNAGGALVTMYAGINIPSDSVVYCAYTKPGSGGLRDESFNYVADFDTFLVFNSVSTSEYQSLSYHKFNGDLTDEYNVYNGTAINTIAYTNDTALIFADSDGNDAVLISSPITGDFSISYWIYLDEGNVNEDYYIFSSSYNTGPAGFYHYANGSGAGTFALQTYAENGTGAGRQYAWDGNYTMLDDTWNHVVMTVDVDGNGTDAYTSFYLNNVDVTTDSIITGFSDFTVTSDIYIANEKAPSPTKGLREGAILGEIAVFDHVLGSWEIDSLYSIRGDRLWKITSTQTPDDYDSTRIVYETVNFTGVTPGVTITESLIDGFFIGSGAPTSTANQEVEDFLGDTVMAFTLPATTANTGVQWQYNMPSSYDEVWFGYNFWVPSDFILPHADSKFPGVTVGGTTTSVPTGGVYPTYCSGVSPIYQTTWGTTLRGLIIQGGYYSPFTDAADGFGIYSYNHSMYFKGACSNPTYGEKYRVPNDYWTYGAWNSMHFRIKANTVTVEGTGDANGILEIYANGVCRYLKTDMVMRNYSDDKIDEYFILLLSGYDLSRTRAQSVKFDDFQLWMPSPGSSLRGGPNAIGTDISSFITTK